MSKAKMMKNIDKLFKNIEHDYDGVCIDYQEFARAKKGGRDTSVRKRQALDHYNKMKDDYESLGTAIEELSAHLRDWDATSHAKNLLKPDKKLLKEKADADKFLINRQESYDNMKKNLKVILAELKKG